MKEKSQPQMQKLMGVFKLETAATVRLIYTHLHPELRSIMKLNVILSLCALFTITQQAPSPEKCLCELTSSENSFPYEKLSTVEGNATNCNTNITPNKTLEMKGFLLGLERRLTQLQKDVSILEREDDGQLYGVLSLYVIENEMVDIKQLIEKLNSTTVAHQHLTNDTTHQLQDLKGKMKEMEKFDTMQVVKGRQANKRLKTDLDDCKKSLSATVAPTKVSQGTCTHGPLVNITGPRVYMGGTGSGYEANGAWGRDPKPEAGKERWYWVVTSSNQYANEVRLYSSLSSVIVGQRIPDKFLIHPSNPTTNTIQGPNNVMYEGALYYNCYNEKNVCRFNLTDKSVTKAELPQGTRYNSKGNFCNMEKCYPYSDLDLVTDESGVWVVYTTTEHFGNLVLSKINAGPPPTLGQTWRTSIYKQAVTNTFMACGILYATRSVNRDVEEVFYSFDTTTGKEKFNIGINLNKMSPNIQALNFSPVDQILHSYSDSYMVSYKVVFE